MNKIKIFLTIFTISIIAFSSFGFTTNCKKEVILNETESAFLNLINEARIQNNLNPLTANQKLMDISRSRCSDMVARNYFSHYTPGGNRVKQGEILGRGDSEITSEMFLNAWLNSQPHREVMLGSRYKKIGIGVIDNNGTRIVTIIFSSR